MADRSAIEWTDATWNPVRGCIKVSPGCAHCYAETFAERFRGVAGHPYEQGFDLRLVPEKLTEPLSWKKPRRVFVNSMSDLFQDGVPDSYIDRVFAVMALARTHTFQVLTKRADRMCNYMAGLGRSFPRLQAACPEGWSLKWSEIPLIGWPLPNVWLGVSVENQHFADERIPLLLQTPAAVRFISAEPLLEEVDLNRIQNPIDSFHASALQGQHDDNFYQFDASLDWVIVGGESGHGARPFDLLWARSIVQQCQAAGVPVFVKQLGANPIQLDGDHVAFCNRKGGDPSEWPVDLRIRQFPETRPVTGT